ncbi:MAG: c-type cytochrome [Methylotenera sp.]|uniref:c-type cytochrome n=1 Tax=Methylotenera sp. TaxID=2051956 RepID=UPI002724DE93|nr:c-type cytochrome [Methylotenera sp.]MDO9394496.1 c-type cytochrome [Methylotenera sp.]MDP1523245.1 c-type cytochrome [Methylotenera sp.]MDZ4211956.1 c-type cytochrome [Methylotenera sp.]
MKHHALGLSLLLLAGCSTQGSDASSASKNTVVKEKAQACATCHDPNLKTGFADAPPLAGRSYDELVAAIQKVRDYKAPQPSLRHDLSDQDVHDVATYFSNLK